jgi:hypothetical protein
MAPLLHIKHSWRATDARREAGFAPPLTILDVGYMRMHMNRRSVPHCTVAGSLDAGFAARDRLLRRSVILDR